MTARRILLLCLLVACAEMPRLQASRLPIQSYTTAQGLPRNSVNCLVPDPSGLIWFCTSEGLARFDGYEFRTFGREQGLPSQMVLNFLVSRKGGFWMMTDAGLCRLPPHSKIGESCRLLAVDQKLGEFQPDSLVEAPDGRIWAATDRALYRSSADGRALELAARFGGDLIADLGLAPDGKVLVSTDQAVYLWDGRSSHILSGSVAKGCAFSQIVVSGGGDIRVAGSCNLYRVTGWGGAAVPSLEPVNFGRTFRADHMVLRRDSSLWLAAFPGLLAWKPQPSGTMLELGEFGAEEGLPYPWVTRLAEDNQGNLWGATEGLGVFRINSTGFRAYRGEDGLGSARISSIFESLAGDLCVTTSPLPEASPAYLRVKHGDRFSPVGFGHTVEAAAWGWGWNQVALQAQDGEWWFETARGVLRFAAAARPDKLRGAVPYQIFDRSTGLGETDIFRVFEDSRRDLWISTVNPHNELVRWERATGQFHHWTLADGWPPDAVAAAIRESQSGALWFGTYLEVVRFRNGRFEKFAMPSNGPLSLVRDLFIDRAGRIWVATAHNGLYRCDNPDDAVPVFRRYGARDGLSSDSTRSITEDNFGFVYVGTVRAVDRVDPQAPIGGGNILHYTAADGLPDAEQNVAYRDRQGHLWFGTLSGLAEYDPVQPAVHSAPEVHIVRVRVHGEDIPLPWEGARSFTVHLKSSERQVEIEYGAIDLRSVASLRYQYRLAGVDSAWSAPSARTSVNYTNLPAGERAFEVRAVAVDGSAGAGAGEVLLILDAPVWRRAWFLALAAFSLGAVGYWLYDYRVRHLLAMERLRTRIATDLHDDIGASLTQISLLSEVGRRDPFRNVLEEIAEISRDLVQEMSDIVWAVSPRHDRFDSMVHRMRRFAEDAMADGEVVFDTSGLPGDLTLPLEYRRPVYLVFKEVVNNVARHAGATRMAIRIATREGSLELAIEDNGRGFDPAASASGEGLSSIRRRIKELSGTVTWVTAPGQGTRFEAAVPLRSHRSLPKWGGALGWVTRL